MNKLISLSLALLLVLSLRACGQEKPEPEEDPKERFEELVKIEVNLYCYSSYANVHSVITDIFSIDVTGDTYTARGKVRIVDDYGDTYVGKLTAVSTRGPTVFGEISLDIETPRKE